MSQPADGHLAAGDARRQGLLERCPRCSMEVRRTEIEIHLAHSHNIGPTVKTDKGKDGRKKRRTPNQD